MRGVNNCCGRCVNVGVRCGYCRVFNPRMSNNVGGSERAEGRWKIDPAPRTLERRFLVHHVSQYHTQKIDHDVRSKVQSKVNQVASYFLGCIAALCKLIAAGKAPCSNPILWFTLHHKTSISPANATCCLSDILVAHLYLTNHFFHLR